MKNPIYPFLAAILVLLIIFFTVNALSAQNVGADFFAVNVDTGFGFPLHDGTRLDHNSAGVDVSKLDIRVVFNWTVAKGTSLSRTILTAWNGLCSTRGGPM